jgi:intraflagellar transport protein 140
MQEYFIYRESVWENMAQMCVKSHRIDVAKVCLGNMGNVKGIRLLNDEAVRGADSDTQVGLIALNLGMIVNNFFLYLRINIWEIN